MKPEKLLKFKLPVGAIVRGLRHLGDGVFVGAPLPPVESLLSLDGPMPLVIEGTVPSEDGKNWDHNIQADVVDDPLARVPLSRVVSLVHTKGGGWSSLQTVLGLSDEEHEKRAAACRQYGSTVSDAKIAAYHEAFRRFSDQPIPGHWKAPTGKIVSLDAVLERINNTLLVDFETPEQLRDAIAGRVADVGAVPAAIQSGPVMFTSAADGAKILENVLTGCAIDGLVSRQQEAINELSQRIQTADSRTASALHSAMSLLRRVPDEFAPPDHPIWAEARAILGDAVFEDGPGEEDGPWAEGWNERAGECVQESGLGTIECRDSSPELAKLLETECVQDVGQCGGDA